MHSIYLIWIQLAGEAIPHIDQEARGFALQRILQLVRSVHLHQRLSAHDGAGVEQVLQSGAHHAGDKKHSLRAALQCLSNLEVRG